jgi:hypothetical protein
VISVVYSCFFHQLFHVGMTLGMQIKAAVIAAVYKKVGRCLSDKFNAMSRCFINPVKAYRLNILSNTEIMATVLKIFGVRHTQPCII